MPRNSKPKPSTTLYSSRLPKDFLSLLNKSKKNENSRAKTDEIEGHYDCLFEKIKNESKVESRILQDYYRLYLLLRKIKQNSEELEKTLPMRTRSEPRPQMLRDSKISSTIKSAPLPQKKLAKAKLPSHCVITKQLSELEKRNRSNSLGSTMVQQDTEEVLLSLFFCYKKRMEKMIEQEIERDLEDNFREPFFPPCRSEEYSTMNAKESLNRINDVKAQIQKLIPKVNIDKINPLMYTSRTNSIFSQKKKLEKPSSLSVEPKRDRSKSLF